MARYSRSRSYSGGRSYGSSRGYRSGRSYSRGSRSSSRRSYGSRTYNGYRQYNSGSGWKFVHRRVAEKKLGGSIRPGYVVHHINGNKTDNRPSNLSVVSRAKHAKIHGR